MIFNNILYEKHEKISHITLNRPKKLNALNQDTLEELRQVFDLIKKDESTRSVIITGAGDKAFVAGADISQFADFDAEKGRKFSRFGQQVFREIEQMNKPVIAAVNGFALGGGCELAMSCHLRLASTNATFGLPEVNLGILPGYGGTQRLPRLIGLSNAIHLMLTGEMINAEKAKQLGLVSEIVAPENLHDRAVELAGLIAKKAPIAVQSILSCIYQGLDKAIETGLQIEADYFGKICQTDDMKEGTKAFLEKRQPNYKGK